MALQDKLDDLTFVFDVVHLKNDTEEDLVGSDLHQTAIRTLCDTLWIVGPDRGLPWHVSSQLVVLMGQLGGKDWRPSPDIFVHPTAGPEPRTSFDSAVEGVPPFVVEVASPGTWEYDVGAKGRSYGYTGVREYIVFDPTTDLLGTPVRAWHASEEGFVPWQPEADGCWHSAVLGLSFQPSGPLLRVFDRAGTLLPTMSEAARLATDQARLATDQARLAADQARLAADQARRIAELEAEVRRLRGDTEKRW